LSQLVALLLAEKAGLGFTRDEAALAELDRAVHSAARAAAERPAAASDVTPEANGASIRKETDHA